MQRSSSTRKSRPAKHDNMILSNTLNERIKALKATQKISHRISKDPTTKSLKQTMI